MDPDRFLSDRVRGLEASAIREILKAVSKPGMISLAGGIPSEESFPFEIIAELSDLVFEKYGPSALQYDFTEGFLPLRRALSVYLTAKKGIPAGVEEVLITSGSQGALDALGKILISRGDRVAVEDPTYLGALQAFSVYGPELVSLETDAEGLLPDSLEAVLGSGRVKFVYLVPNFQNPTGRTLSLERRFRVAELLKRYQALLIEDDPYGDLRYEGESIPPVKVLASEHVIYLGSFSKVFAPGLRVGYCLAPDWVRSWLVRVKQGVDLHSGTFGQALAAEYLAGGHIETQLPRIRDLYRPRKQAMLDALDACFPKSFRWSRPQGGMFIWVEGPETLDTEELHRKALAENVAFVPGRYFFARSGRGFSTMRLNFTRCDPGVSGSAILVLSGIIRRMLRRPAVEAPARLHPTLPGA
jgi:2-aminoadipate transaminase